MNITIAIAAVSMHAASSPGMGAALESVDACFQQQLECTSGICAPATLNQACGYSGLSSRAEAIVRTETLSLAQRISAAEDPEACSTELANQYQSAVNSIRNDGPMGLSEPYAYTQGSSELSETIERELFWRAQLDERLTGQASDRIRNRTESACGLPPYAVVVQLRAQNLALAEIENVLERAREGDLSAPARWAAWFIYNHSDLWQAEQAEAAQVFGDLADQGGFSTGLASNLRGRVSNHQPLYAESDLAQSWGQD